MEKRREKRREKEEGIAEEMATDCIILVGPSQDTRLREAGAKVVCCLTRGPRRVQTYPGFSSTTRMPFSPDTGPPRTARRGWVLATFYSRSVMLPMWLGSVVTLLTKHLAPKVWAKSRYGAGLPGHDRPHSKGQQWRCWAERRPTPSVPAPQLLKERRDAAPWTRPSPDTRLREAGVEAVYCLARGAPKGPNIPRAQLNHQGPLFPGHGYATHSQTWVGEPTWLGVRSDATHQAPTKVGAPCVRVWWPTWLGSVVTLLTKHLAPKVQAPPAGLGVRGDATLQTPAFTGNFYTIFLEHNPFYGDNAGTLESLEEFFLTSVKEVVLREDSTDGVQCADSVYGKRGPKWCIASPGGPRRVHTYPGLGSTTRMPFSPDTGKPRTARRGQANPHGSGSVETPLSKHLLSQVPPAGPGGSTAVTAHQVYSDQRCGVAGPDQGGPSPALKWMLVSQHPPWAWDPVPLAPPLTPVYEKQGSKRCIASPGGPPKGPNIPRAQLNHQGPLFPGHRCPLREYIKKMQRNKLKHGGLWQKKGGHRPRSDSSKQKSKSSRWKEGGQLRKKGGCSLPSRDCKFSS
ncbi:hypothetical protein ISCGN_016058 [Ixodes scapularis]